LRKEIQVKSTERKEIKPGVFRSCTYTDNLMTAVIDFTNGPWTEAEPPHNHPHEQVSCVAEGEVIFYCEGRPDRHLKPGDMFAVASDLKHTIRLLTERVRIIDSFTPIREEFLDA
jgi:quercetin dioxygenase-like cupin family protein